MVVMVVIAIVIVISIFDVFQWRGSVGWDYFRVYKDPYREV